MKNWQPFFQTYIGNKQKSKYKYFGLELKFHSMKLEISFFGKLSLFQMTGETKFQGPSV
jgi:hypothetical protein